MAPDQPVEPVDQFLVFWKEMDRADSRLVADIERGGAHALTISKFAELVPKNAFKACLGFNLAVEHGKHLIEIAQHLLRIPGQAASP